MHCIDSDEENPKDPAFKRWAEAKAPKETREAGERREGGGRMLSCLLCIVALGTFRLATPEMPQLMSQADLL